MKLAQALIERADLQKRIQLLQNRLNMNARVQEGEAPAENPEELLREFDSLVEQLEQLIVRINNTNGAAVHQGKTLTELLAKRDCLHIKIQGLQSFLKAASDVVSRASYSEIKIKSTVSVAQLQKQVDKLSKELRELDTHIQALNWTTELL